jgi:hypothetical protein
MQPNTTEAQMINLLCFEVWTDRSENARYIMTVYVETDAIAERIAEALGGIAEYELCGVLRPE